jgi:hypothetical protein
MLAVLRRRTGGSWVGGVGSVGFAGADVVAGVSEHTACDPVPLGAIRVMGLRPISNGCVFVVASAYRRRVVR